MIVQGWAQSDSLSSPVRPVFLDRDGVLVDLVDRYALARDTVCELPGVRCAASRLASAGFKAIVVTNQSGIGRGLVSVKQALDINTWILNQVDPDRHFIEFTLICPHTPEDNCSCRKPLTHGIEQFVSPIDRLQGHWFVGDQMTDLQCAESLGMQPVLVQTGQGRKTLRRIHELRQAPKVVENFSAFADLALQCQFDPELMNHEELG